MRSYSSPSFEKRFVFIRPHEDTVPSFFKGSTLEAVFKKMRTRSLETTDTCGTTETNEIAAFSKRSSHAWTRLFILTTKTTKIGYCDVNRSMCSSITSISNSILSPSQSSKGYLRLYKVFFLYSLTNSSNSLINN